MDHDLVEYESGADERHLDLAARYSHSFGPLDIGLSISRRHQSGAGFPTGIVAADPRRQRGTNSRRRRAGRRWLRIPWLRTTRRSGSSGWTAQVTAEAWLFKLEAIHRAGAPSRPSQRHPLGKEADYTAFAFGTEYTFYSVFESTTDLGLLGEWNHDERGRQSTNKFQNDLFLAARLAFNDVNGAELVAGLVADADYATRTLNVEWSRRLSDKWSVRLEGVGFLEADKADPVSVTRRDSFIALEFVYHF